MVCWCLSGIVVMESFKRESEMECLSEEELKRFKHWLFEENVRISAERKEIKDTQERLKRESQLFDKKMQILQDGFQKLDIDRKKLEKEKRRFRLEREYYEEDRFLYDDSKEVTAQQLFCGVNNRLTLKKRYKDLIKIYHPDNLAGNHEMVLMINKEYERLKQQLEQQWKIE